MSTLRAVEKALVTDSLVFRYDPESDGLDGGEGTFSICSFWYVEALTRAGRLDDAQLALEGWSVLPKLHLWAGEFE